MTTKFTEGTPQYYNKDKELKTPEDFDRATLENKEGLLSEFTQYIDETWPDKYKMPTFIKHALMLFKNDYRAHKERLETKE